MSTTTIALTVEDKKTLRTAAYGTVSLLSAASTSPHKVATASSLALTSATGLVGHVLAERSKIENLHSKSVAGLADHVLPALTATMVVLEKHSPAEAANFRGTITAALDTARTYPSPASTEMIRKITAALDAA